MATLQLALQLPQDIDLRGFSLLLHTQNIVHRITLEGVYQVVWIGSDIRRPSLRSIKPG